MFSVYREYGNNCNNTNEIRQPMKYWRGGFILTTDCNEFLKCINTGSSACKCSIYFPIYNFIYAQTQCYAIIPPVHNARFLVFKNCFELWFQASKVPPTSSAISLRNRRWTSLKLVVSALVSSVKGTCQKNWPQTKSAVVPQYQGADAPLHLRHGSYQHVGPF